MAQIYTVDLGSGKVGGEVARYDTGAAAHVEDDTRGGDGGVDYAVFH